MGLMLVEAVLNNNSQSKTSVAGGRWKKSLSKNYAKIKKKAGGSGSADMFLEGDMAASYAYETFRDGVEFGIFDSEQAQKADNHNKFSGKSRGTSVPERNSRCPK